MSCGVISVISGYHLLRVFDLTWWAAFDCLGSYWIPRIWKDYSSWTSCGCLSCVFCLERPPTNSNLSRENFRLRFECDFGRVPASRSHFQAASSHLVLSALPRFSRNYPSHGPILQSHSHDMPFFEDSRWGNPLKILHFASLIHQYLSLYPLSACAAYPHRPLSQQSWPLECSHPSWPSHYHWCSEFWADGWEQIVTAPGCQRPALLLPEAPRSWPLRWNWSHLIVLNKPNGHCSYALLWLPWYSHWLDFHYILLAASRWSVLPLWCFWRYLGTQMSESCSGGAVGRWHGLLPCCSCSVVQVPAGCARFCYLPVEIFLLLEPDPPPIYDFSQIFEWYLLGLLLV